MHPLPRSPRRETTVANPKKSERCSASLTIAESDMAAALAAALTTEGAEVTLDDDSLTVNVQSETISDLRARLNTTLRSLQAASEALTEADRASQ